MEGAFADDDRGIVMVQAIEILSQARAGDRDNVADVSEIGPGGGAGWAGAATVERLWLEAVEDDAGNRQRTAQGKEQIDLWPGGLPERLVGDNAPQGVRDEDPWLVIGDGRGNGISCGLAASLVAQIGADLTAE